ncbi:hypothetical protein [Pantoea piersonii]|uniref:hypothetical protein n=1 Tax=Pantoea piersonii TaxID=2364647 RepID=UPI0022F192BB|nr:hypothetical protein [Pantoea piersonii]WBV23532.1 hypothetical protein PG877_04385 [Pantoea piersonii]
MIVQSGSGRLDIGSTASADKNRLERGTLGFSDIENRADYKTEHQSAGISTGGSIAVHIDMELYRHPLRRQKLAESIRAQHAKLQESNQK